MVHLYSLSKVLDKFRTSKITWTSTDCSREGRGKAIPKRSFNGKLKFFNEVHQRTKTNRETRFEEVTSLDNLLTGLSYIKVSKNFKHNNLSAVLVYSIKSFSQWCYSNVLETNSVKKI